MKLKEALHIRTEKNPMNKDKGPELDPVWFLSVVWKRFLALKTGARFFRPQPIPDKVIPCIFAVSFAALPIPEDPLPILEEKAHSRVLG